MLQTLYRTGSRELINTHL